MLSIYDLIDETDLETIYLLDIRKLTFIEKFIVGFRLWKHGVSKFPFPVKQNRF